MSINNVTEKSNYAVPECTSCICASYGVCKFVKDEEGITRLDSIREEIRKFFKGGPFVIGCKVWRAKL